MSAKIKKGGRVRYIVSNAVNTDHFEVPAGFSIESLYVEKLDTVAGNLKLGTSYVAPVVAEKEKLQFLVTHEATGSGNITVVIRGTSHTVAVSAGDTPAEIAAKIANTAYSGWVLSSINETVYIEAAAAGAKVGSNTFTDTGTTGTLGVFYVRNPGVDGVAATIGEQVYASAALSETEGNVSEITPLRKFFSMTADTNVYIGVSSAADFNMYVVLQKLN